MAKMVTNNLVVSVSKLYKNTDDPETILTSDQIEQLEAVIKELIADDTVMVEIDEVSE